MHHVRAVAATPTVTPADVIAAGARAAALARTRADVRSVADVLELLACEAEVVEAVRARIEMSSAMEVDRIAAWVLEDFAAGMPQDSWRVAGGNQRLPDAMARRLGDAVHLGEPVRRIVHDEREVLVATDSGTEGFDAVVVALPLAVVRDTGVIDIALPEWKRQVLARLLHGHAAKLHLPLRSAPGTSAVMSARGRFWTWTALADEEHVAPVLNCFMGSESAIRAAGVADDPGRWVQATRTLRDDLDFDAARSPTVTVWRTDPYARGAYSGPAPGVTANDYTLLQRPVGAIYFAGEYVERDTFGLMEGAIRSGERAADRVLEA